MDALADRPRGGGEEGGEVVASCFPEGQIYNSVSSSRTRGGKSLGEGKVGGGGYFGISFSQTRVRFSVTRLRDSDVRLAPLSADTYPVSTHFSPRILTKFPSFDPTTIACETNAVTRHVSFSRAKQRVYPRTKLQRAFSSELRFSKHLLLLRTRNGRSLSKTVNPSHIFPERICTFRPCYFLTSDGVSQSGVVTRRNFHFAHLA